MLSFLPDLSRLTLATNATDDDDLVENLFGSDDEEELTLEKIAEMLMTPSEDESDLPTPVPSKPICFLPHQNPRAVVPRPKRVELMQPPGVSISVGGQKILISDNPYMWTALSQDQINLLFSNDELKQNVIHTKTIKTDNNLRLVLLLAQGLCTDASTPTRTAVSVLDRGNRSLSKEDNSVSIDYGIKNKRIELSTNPFRPTIVRAKRFAKLGVTELPGTRFVSSNGFEMYRGLPKNAPNDLDSLSIMSTTICGESGTEPIYLVSAQIHDLNPLKGTFKQPRSEAEKRWGRKCIRTALAL